jgi:tRNA (cytidine/uridine-2'-O-)-methyltransferase
MGFVLSDRQLKRSAMDYWPRLKLTVHDDNDAFFAALGDEPRWFFDSTGEVDLWEADFRAGDWLIFGSETIGVADSILRANCDRVVRIPQVASERCLNLSTAAGIALYEALRQVTRPSDAARPGK